MNIFFLHLDPKTNAKFYINKHCVKIILECAQMLYTALWKNNESAEWVELHEKDLNLPPYKATHFNHPTTKWVRMTLENYKYTIDTALALCYEYTSRYHKIHKCQIRLEWLRDNPPTFSEYKELTHHCATKNIPQGCTPIPLAMPVEYYSDDVLYSYRLYYIVEKFKLITKTDTIDCKQTIIDWNLNNNNLLIKLQLF